MLHPKKITSMIEVIFIRLSILLGGSIFLMRSIINIILETKINPKHTSIDFSINFLVPN